MVIVLSILIIIFTIVLDNTIKLLYYNYSNKKRGNDNDIC